MARDSLEKRTLTLLLGGAAVGTGIWLVLRSGEAKAKSPSKTSSGTGTGDTGTGGTGTGGTGTGGTGTGTVDLGTGLGGESTGGEGTGDEGAGGEGAGGEEGGFKLPSDLSEIKDLISFNPNTCEPLSDLPDKYKLFIGQKYAPSRMSNEALFFVWPIHDPTNSDYEHARALLRAATKGDASCVDTIPWFDEYVKEHEGSIPDFSPGMKVKPWVDAFRQWNSDHEAAYAAFRQGHTGLAKAYDETLFMLAAGALSALGSNPAAATVGDVQAPANANQTAKATAVLLRNLGYFQDGTFSDSVREFQEDFNGIFSVLSDYVVPNALDVDGLVGPETFAAAQFANIFFENPWRWAVAKLQSLGL